MLATTGFIKDREGVELYLGPLFKAATAAAKKLDDLDQGRKDLDGAIAEGVAEGYSPEETLKLVDKAARDTRDGLLTVCKTAKDQAQRALKDMFSLVPENLKRVQPFEGLNLTADELTDVAANNADMYTVLRWCASQPNGGHIASALNAYRDTVATQMSGFVKSARNVALSDGGKFFSREDAFNMACEGRIARIEGAYNDLMRAIGTAESPKPNGILASLAEDA